MPRLVGNARSITDAARAVVAISGTCVLLAAFPACLLEVVLPALVEAVRIEKCERARASQAWHDMYGNYYSLDHEIEMEFNPMFRATFRMNREDFQELRAKLGIPLTMRTRCDKRFTGTTGLLVLLARMGSPATLETLGKVLRMNPKRISAIANTMVRWMYAKWGHVILGGLIEPRLTLYAEAVHRATGIAGVHIFGFIDGTVRGTARPVYGQESMYTRHKSKHGVKYQALALPDGLLACLYGPRSVRRHDSKMLTDSGLEEAIMGIQGRTGIEYCINGDAAYQACDIMMTGYNRAQCTSDPLKEWWTRTMNPKRTCVEWSFGRVRNVFPGLDTKNRNQMLTTPVGLYYQTACFLTNCITCLEGGCVHYTQFHLTPPTLDHYLASED